MRRILPVLFAFAACVSAAEPLPTPRGNRILADYFAREVAEIEGNALPEPKSAEEWEKTRAEMRAQLADMLGLSPMPQRTPLNPVITGEIKESGIAVEKLHFQSLPGLYVTANLYRPEKVERKLPAVLYVCGHSNMTARDGTSLGNKAGYEHHGVWFAKRGYVCLIIDTVQLGEIRGEHHGTYSKGRWWWMSRGYTPAGIEAWNGIRALDYLVSRPEVDAERIGVNGRSGGGAYSWWIGALDDRVKVVVPTAGITTLRNHVVDGCIEGHCDCMFQVNTRRWDYDRVAALIAPRPLLIANTDKDSIFPLDGVISVYSSARRIYRALGAEGKIGLHIAEGPHKDTQPLNTGEFAWLERHLKGAEPTATVALAAEKSIDPEKLRVFTSLPSDERNTRIDAEFVPAAKTPKIPADTQAFEKLRASWIQSLKSKSFAGWPRVAADLQLRSAGSSKSQDLVMEAWDFCPQEPWQLRLYVLHREGATPQDLESVTLQVLDAGNWPGFCDQMANSFPSLFDQSARKGPAAAGVEKPSDVLKMTNMATAYVAPRGVGPTAWQGSEKQQAHRLRRFYLLGQTLDGMQVWDIRRAIAALREAGFGKAPLRLQAGGTMAGNALYASLFEDGIERLFLHDLPSSHQQGPTYLNVLRTLDLPQAVAAAASRSKVFLYHTGKDTWSWPSSVAGELGWNGALEFPNP